MKKLAKNVWATLVVLGCAATVFACSMELLGHHSLAEDLSAFHHHTLFSPSH